jgi:hypothetical protein
MNGSAATMLVALLSRIFFRRNRGHQQLHVSETKATASINSPKKDRQHYWRESQSRNLL